MSNGPTRWAAPARAAIPSLLLGILAGAVLIALDQEGAQDKLPATSARGPVSQDPSPSNDGSPSRAGDGAVVQPIAAEVGDEVEPAGEGLGNVVVSPLDRPDVPTSLDKIRPMITAFEGEILALEAELRGKEQELSVCQRAWVACREGEDSPVGQFARSSASEFISFQDLETLREVLEQFPFAPNRAEAEALVAIHRRHRAPWIQWRSRCRSVGLDQIDLSSALHGYDQDVLSVVGMDAMRIMLPRLNGTIGDIRSEAIRALL